jgi:hypothetical protein
MFDSPGVRDQRETDAASNPEGRAVIRSHHRNNKTSRVAERLFVGHWGTSRDGFLIKAHQRMHELDPHRAKSRVDHETIRFA